MDFNDQKKIFKDNLRNLLADRNVSQRDVCEALGIAPQTFNSWAMGKSLPRSDKAKRLAEFFGVERQVLYEEHPSESRISKLAAMMEAHPIYWEVIDAVSGMDEEGLRLAIRLLRTMKEAGNE